MRYSPDIETALYELLTASGYNASAHALPATFTLPHIHITRTGGYTSSLVIELNNIDFDVYAEDPADAMTAASNLCGWIRNLEGNDVDTPCYQSEVTTLPYDNPDPRHPTLARATVKAQILIRTKGTNNA